jgi:putative ABC transport system substrate-binding protein
VRRTSDDRLRVDPLDAFVTRRWAILGGLAAAACAIPSLGHAQPTGPLPRVGFVQAEVASSGPLREAFFAGLRELGWVDGRNVTIDWRRRDGEIRDLVRLNPAVLVLPNPYRIEAGLRLTKTIPIVTVDLESDPVARGFIKGLARPGGNLTGIWMDVPEIAGKQLQLLKEAVPDLRRVAVVWDDRIAALQFGATEASARASGITLHSAPLRDEREIDAAVKRAVVNRPQAVLILTSPILLRAQTRLAQLALESRLPSMSGFSTFPDSGGLMAYGPDFPTIWRQAASYVDRILRGAKPGDLPVERPAKFELRINARTARSLGLALSPSLLARADEVLQ